MLSIKTIKFLDKHIGSLVCLILHFFKSPCRQKKAPGNILVVQLWGIGESVLTLPSLHALRKKFPKATIDVLLTERNRDVYFRNKDINKAISIKLNPLSILKFILHHNKEYDLVIDMEEYLNVSAIISFFVGYKRIGFSHKARSLLYTDTVKYNDNQHASQTFADLLKKAGIDFRVNGLIRLNYSSADKKAVESLLKNKIGKSSFVVGIAPGAAESAKSRMWPKENFSELSNKLISMKGNIIVVFVGNEQEKHLIKDIIERTKGKGKIINLAGKITLRQLFCLAEKADVFISNDTGPMHIAAAQGTKTIGLFGPNLPARFGPLNRKSVSLYKGKICAFSPCINVHKGEVPDCLYPKCSRDYQKCVKNIKVADVLNAI
jgi:heptosyltransferase-2